MQQEGGDSKSLPATTSQHPVVEFSKWNRDQIELVKRTVAKGATDDELALFAHVAQRAGLDPFARQIHAVKRWSAEDQREVMTIQTGIDGYRLIAERTGLYAPGPEPTFEHGEGGKLISATAYVKKKTKDGEWHVVAATAFYAEYVQTKKDGSPTRFWQKMPHGQLAKCAEALALRRAFPMEMSGILTHEEMAQAENDSSLRARVTAQFDATRPAPAGTPPTLPGNNPDPPPTTPPPELQVSGDAKTFTPDEYRAEIRRMIGELCNDDETAMRATLEHLTQWTDKDGKLVAGRRTVGVLTDKQLPIVFGKVREEYWQQFPDKKPKDAPKEKETDIPF